MEHPSKNIAETTREIMEKFGATETLEPNTGEEGSPLTKPYLLSVPKERRIEDLSDSIRRSHQFLKPARRKGTARLSDLSSLIAWANRFKGPNSTLFATPDMSAPTLTCIADYHAEGPADAITPGGDPTARHCHHRAIYDFPLSEEWKAWNAVNGKALEKDELGEFIEAHAMDIFDPTPAVLKGSLSEKNEPWENRLIETAMKIEGRYGQLNQLLSMSKQFQVYETSNLKVSTNRDTGEQEIQFLNEHKTADGKPLHVPNLIIIAIPVFQNGAPYRMPVRFRYRKSGGQLRFILSIYNPEKAFESAFNEAVDFAENETGLVTFKGKPES